MNNKIFLTWEQIDCAIEKLSKEILMFNKYKNIYSIPRGGLIVGVMLSHKTNLPMIFDFNKITFDTLIVDDISDTGKTLEQFSTINDVCCLVYTQWTSVVPKFKIFEKHDSNTWFVFPWENKDTEETYSLTEVEKIKEDIQMSINDY